MEANRRVLTSQAASTTMMAALIDTVIRGPTQSYSAPWIMVPTPMATLITIRYRAMTRPRMDSST